VLLSLALAVELGQAVVERSLGEREPLFAGALSFVLGLSALGLLGNLLLRTTLRIDLTLALLPSLLVLARILVARWRVRPQGPEAAPPLGGRARAAAALFALAAVLPMALVLRAHHPADEWETHLPLAGSIANGIVPLVHPYLPDAPFAGAFGFDLLAALAGYGTGLPLDRVFAALSTLLFLASVLGAASFLRAHAGGRLEPFALAAGLSWLLPGIFLPKPMALGLAVWVATLRLIGSAQRTGDLAVAAAAGLALGFLGLTEVALFTMTAGAIVACGFARALVERRVLGRAPLVALVAVSTAVAVALVGGGLGGGRALAWQPLLVGLGLFLALSLVRAAAGRPRPFALAAGLIALSMGGLAAPGRLHFLRVAADPEPAPSDPQLALDAQVTAWLRSHADVHDRVLTSSIYPSALGGLLTPLPTQHVDPLPPAYPPAMVDQVSGAVERALRTLDPVGLACLRIRWIVLGEQDLPRLAPEARARLAQAEPFRKVLDVERGRLRRQIYEYEGGPPPGGR